MRTLVLTDLAGLLFCPYSRIATVREEWEGRLEVTDRDGRVAHRPGPLPEGLPLVPAGPGVWVHADPAGDSPPLDDPWVDDADARASQVLYLDAGGRGQSWWVSDRGRTRGRLSLSGRQKAALHPDLRQAGQGLFVNPDRLRFLRRVPGDRAHYDLGFDDGTLLRLAVPAASLLATHLGLPDPEWCGGETEGQRHLRRLGLRRWPVRLATATAEDLRAWFPDTPARLLANLAMQTVQARRAGEPVLEGDGHRAWYYRPVRGVLARAGHLALGFEEEGPEFPEPVEPPESPRPRRDYRRLDYPTFGAQLPMTAEGAWSTLCRLLTHLVFEARLFTYQDLGFRDLKPEFRRLGSAHPGVVVLVEKESLLEAAWELHRLHGVTVFVTGGLPPVLGAEFLARDLRARGVSEVRIASYCDYDVEGWDMPTVLAPQLARYGLPTAGICRLVTPRRFTADELDRLSVPLPEGPTPVHRARMRRWMSETGGIGGRRRGIAANHLPMERVASALAEVLGEWDSASPPPSL